MCEGQFDRRYGGHAKVCSVATRHVGLLGNLADYNLRGYGQTRPSVSVSREHEERLIIPVVRLNDWTPSTPAA